MKVEFYYSSKDEPAKQYLCDNKKALDLCSQLQAKGVNVKVQDCGEEAASFMTYNAAVTGPSAAKRAVFGTKGALEEEFGKAVPALLVFDKEGERYPTEVYPRMDKEQNKLIGPEEALQNLLSQA
ncbi:MAG: hypothetical protein U9R33_03945 [candidate division NC10 bacterium]|jgi:hypothetical protein|nr:hypothetical protein [candidate division NC10 bacterium]